MGNFANSMFSVMLSWVRAAVNWIWQFFSSEDNGGFFTWVGENWVGVTITLCVVCMAVDFIVHMFRWQPYKVWASFLRRLLGRDRPGDDEPALRRCARPRHPRRVVQREVFYADGTARREEVEQPLEDEEDAWYAPDVPPARVSSADMSQQYVMQFARPQENMPSPPMNLQYQQELDKVQPLEGLEDYPQPVLVVPEIPQAEEEMPHEPPMTQTERIRKRMARLNLQHFLHNDEDELNLRYKPAPPAVDKHEAYGKPYYPPQWQRPGDAGASYNREE